MSGVIMLPALFRPHCVHELNGANSFSG